MHGVGKCSLDVGIVFQLAKRLQSMGAILPGKSSAQRLITRVYLQSHCFDRSRELGNINRAYSVIAAALGCVSCHPEGPALMVYSTFTGKFPFWSSDWGTYDAE